MKGAVAVVAGLLWVLDASPSIAAPFELDWSAPPGCPSRERMLAATRERLGEQDSIAAPDLLLRGSVSFEQNAIVVQLHMRDAAGAPIGDRTVRVDGTSCETIEAPTSLVLAMMITVARPRDPGTSPSPPPPAPPEAPPPAPPEAPPPAPPEAPPLASPPSGATRASAGPRVRASVVLAGASSVGLLPAVGFGGALRSTATLGSRLLFALETSFEASRTEPAGAAGRATMTLVDLGLLGGVRVARSTWSEIVPIAGLRGGVLTASAEGFPLVRTAERMVGVVAVGVLGRILLGPALRLDVLPEVRVPLSRDEFQIRKGGELIHVHQPSFVAFRLTAGIGLEFR